MGHLSDAELEAVQKILGVRFINSDYLIQALTHSSYAKQHRKNDIKDNERLEFLGDAVLKLVVSDYFFARFDESGEGKLTKFRSKVISDRHLAELGAEMGLGKFIRFSSGEKKSGGATRPSNLGNVVEAVVGAIFLDQGYPEAKAFFIRILKQHIDDWTVLDEVTDYKSSLQELLQKFKDKLPTYRIIREEGPDHEKVFHVELNLHHKGMDYVFNADASTRKEAEQLAARKALRNFDVIS